MANFLNNQSFVDLPTCTAVPSSGSQLINKTYGDATYATIAGEVTLAGPNAFTGNNSFNVDLPTSTVTPTSATQLITKAYADATYGSLAASQTWLGTDTFNVNPLFPTAASVGYVATCTNATTGAWTWQVSSSPSTASVTTTDATPTTLISVAIPANGVVTITGTVNGSDTLYANAISGFFVATAISASSVATLVSSPFVVNIASNLASSFNAMVSGSNLIIQVIGFTTSTFNWHANYSVQTN